MTFDCLGNLCALAGEQLDGSGVKSERLARNSGPGKPAVEEQNGEGGGVWAHPFHGDALRARCPKRCLQRPGYFVTAFEEHVAHRANARDVFKMKMLKPTLNLRVNATS